MNKQIKQQIKQRITNVVEVVDEFNIDQAIDVIDTHLKALGTLHSLETQYESFMDAHTVEDDDEEEEDDEEIPPEPSDPDTDKSSYEHQETLNELSAIFDTKPEPKGYYFDRKLSGGFLLTGSAESNIFVPERVIRSLDLENGDYVEAHIKEGSSTHKPLYDFYLTEKGPGDTEGDRQVFEYGHVEWNAPLARYTVSKDVFHNYLKDDDGRLIKYDVSQKEVDDFRLEEGDIVDLAWYKNHFNKARISWKHLTDSNDTPTESKKQLAYTPDKPNKDKPDKEQSLDGVIITLIGNEPYWPNLKQVVESRGGTIQLVEGERSKISVNAEIRRSDAVIVAINYTSHDMSIYAHERAKNYGIPIDTVDNFGQSTFLRTIEALLA